MANRSSTSVIPTPATPDVCTLTILIDSKEVPGTTGVISVSVSKELNRVPSATIHVSDGEPATGNFEVSNTDQFIPGKTVEIKLGYRAQESTVFKGIIIKHSVRIRKSGSYLVVECRDKAIRMTSGLRSAYFEDQKDSDILEDLIDKYQLEKNVEATTPQLKQVVQFNASDWDFMICRAEANGKFAMVDDGVVTIAKPDVSQDPVVSISFGSTILELDAEIDARLQSPSVKAHSWDASDQQVIEAEANEPSATNNGNLSHDDLSNALGVSVNNLNHAGKLTSPELQAWADAQLQRERLAKVRGRARFQGFAGVKPGHIVEIVGGGERIQGKVFVAGVKQSFSGGNWETDIQFGVNPDRFADVHKLMPLPAAGLLPGIGGLHTGIVTKLGGDPDGEDRIKIRLPLISPHDEGTWARIATLDAGKSRGTYFRPEIDDEVVVGFLHDDPRDPIVLGMCHSSNKPAPEAPNDDNHHKGYVSREKLKMTFDDDKKVISLETPGGNLITLSEDAKGIKLQDQNGNKIVMDDKGITMESFKDFIVKTSAGDVKIDGMNINSNASVSYKAQGSASAEVSGATTTVKGSGTVVVQGGTVMIN